MEIFSEINSNNKGLALALGYFDGVHSGHVEVVKSAVTFARENGTQSAVITFQEHPQVILRGSSPAYITTVEQRREKLAQLGVDFCYELNFADISGFSGREYLQNILIENFEPISISTGFNHYFGVEKSGSPELLASCSEEFGYKYFKIPSVEVLGETVSSSLIRKKLSQGEICAANALLGHSFAVNGVVKKGVGLASNIGFKTANLTYPKNIVRVPFGVYATRVSIDGMSYLAIANFGVKPTFTSLVDEPVLEVHILDFNRDIYGRELRVEFLDFIRFEKKFVSVEELVAQIKRDILCLAVQPPNTRLNG